MVDVATAFRIRSPQNAKVRVKSGPRTSLALAAAVAHANNRFNSHPTAGGSNGATMRFNPESGHGANAGLKIARELMEGVKAKHPGLSYAGETPM